MPLIQSCSLDALRENIAKEISGGAPRDQAVAAAYSALRRACADENKPVPTAKEQAGVAREFKRKRGERSADYLEAALAEAKKALPHRHFAVLHQAARSRAGGRASARNRLSSVEKAALLGAGSLTTHELQDAIDRATELHAAGLRRGIDAGGAALAALFDREASRRTSAAKSDGKESVTKGFVSGDADAGAHAHGLVRSSGKTAKDGAHSHYFRMPGTGLLVRTDPDGEHEHAIGDGGGKTAKDGAHSHKVYVSGGMQLDTSLGGAHAHELLLETSGMGAQHTHELTLPDGTVLTSLSIAEALASGVQAADSGPLPDARALLSGWRRAAMLEHELYEARTAALAQLARESDAKAPPTAAVEIISMSDGAVEFATADGKTGSAACELDVEAGDLVELGATADGEHASVEAHSAATVSADHVTVAQALEKSADHKRYGTPVPFTGPDDAAFVFVAGAPSELELARGEPLVGSDGAAFAEVYLAPLRLTKSQVAIGFAQPCMPRSLGEAVPDEAWLAKQLARWPNARVVALGKIAKAALGDRAVSTLPHPTAVRSGGARFTEQASRKIRALAKSLDSESADGEDEPYRSAQPSKGQEPGTLAGVIGELKAAGQIQVRISKAADEKQIVYGVVLDPYTVDTQGEWVPPAEIESTAHGFVKRSRVIGVEHKRKATASLVESFVVPYPTAKDYKAAMSNLPHVAYEMPYGEDKVHSGSWIAGVELGPEEWAAYKRGDITGFSIGGFSFKTRVPMAAMPAVEFAKLAPVM